MYTLTAEAFERWLQDYKAAWEARDSAAAAALFASDAEYYWTPFDPPQRGRVEIAAAWEGAVLKQKNVTFDYSVLAVAAAKGVAHWHTRLTSVPQGEEVELDGVVIAEFAGAGQCRTFREWWHVKSGADDG
ncbi:MAG: nuclear transport factor 2 family protein [Steroidobacteraceae bacterium]